MRKSKMYYWSDDQIAQMKNHASYANSMIEFAEAIGVHYLTARKYAKELDLNIPDGRWKSGSMPKTERNHEIYTKWEGGLSYSELARQYDVTRQRIYAIVSEQRVREIQQEQNAVAQKQ